MTQPRFNLIDEPWIPIAHHGLVSLKTLFSTEDLPFLGGSVLEKLALFKCLLAIAQAACTPKDNKDWQALKGEPFSRQCLSYLDKWHSAFYLYGDQPFLQVPAIKKAELKPLGALQVEVASGNTTVLTQTQLVRPLSDAQKALILLVQMNFSLGGKKTDNKVVLSPGYLGKQNEKGKPSSAKFGPSMGFMGYLHSFLVTQRLVDSLWLNLLTQEMIAKQTQFSCGLGQAPWEQMPQGEDDAAASQLKNSIMGRLVGLSRFCLLTDSGVHYSEGLNYPDYKDGQYDLSISVKTDKDKTRALWVDPHKRPWRELPALLGFLSSNNASSFHCPLIELGIERIGDYKQLINTIGIYSAGLKVSSNAGEQYATKTDDVVDSLVEFEVGCFNEAWYALFKQEMEQLDELAKQLYGAINHYYKALNLDGKKHTARALDLFWQLAERPLDDLLEACNHKHPPAALKPIKQHYAQFAYMIYDQVCPKVSPRQINAWAKHRINTAKYLNHLATDTQPVG